MPVFDSSRKSEFIKSCYWEGPTCQRLALIIIVTQPSIRADGESGQRHRSGDIANFASLACDEGKCVIIVTHSSKVTSIADEVWGIKDGRLLFIKQA